MIIAEKKVVVLHYKLQKDNENGELIEETNEENPLAFIYGIGMMLPDFEAKLVGKKAGDDFAFGIKSENAYGGYEENAIVDIPMSIFVVDGKPSEELLVLGKVIPMKDQEGRPLRGKITKITDDTVTMDFNHPMAGQNLYFTGLIKTIRDASPEEMDHKHVHGEGGHDH